MRLSILLLALPALLAAQQRDIAAAADTVFARWNSTHSPGCAVGVSREGRVLFTRGYGMANLETGTPITPQTIFESGSVAKQFTATAVLLLALDGKFSLDDPVRRYLPEMPEYDRPITIRHLLTHTSGLREWSSLVSLAGWPRGSRAHTQADLLDVAFRQKALNYPVGDHYSYTNTGYAIAMSLVERVSGKPFHQFTRERIFEPLGMRQTSWRDDFTRIVPGRAQAYSRGRDAWQLEMPFESVVGPGGMLTTAGDWLIWNDAIANRKLGAVSDSLVRRMRLTNGREITYALGVTVSQYRGVPEVSHSGSTGGYSTFLARYPDRGNLSIAILCNSAQAVPTTYTRQLADRLISDFPAPPARDTGRADAASLARWYGVYRNERTYGPLEVGDEVARRLRLLSDGSYLLSNGARWIFDTAGGKPGFRVVQPDGDTVRNTLVAREPWKPDVTALRAYEGAYRSDEIGVTYSVRVSGDSLRASARPGVTVTLRPAYPDAFARGGTTIWFSRDRAGRVVAMHVSEGRLWDLVMPRIGK